MHFYANPAFLYTFLPLPTAHLRKHPPPQTPPVLPLPTARLPKPPPPSVWDRVWQTCDRCTRGECTRGECTCNHACEAEADWRRHSTKHSTSHASLTLPLTRTLPLSLSSPLQRADALTCTHLHMHSHSHSHSHSPSHAQGTTARQYAGSSSSNGKAGQRRRHGAPPPTWSRSARRGGEGLPVACWECGCGCGKGRGSVGRRQPARRRPQSERRVHGH